jgi:hypothetical protein
MANRRDQQSSKSSKSKQRFSDEETTAALALFNQGVETSKNEEQARREADRTERKRKDAAAKLKAVLADQDASPEARAEAETAYREAAAEWSGAGSEPSED